MKTMQGKGPGSGLPAKLRENINNPINFKPLTQDLAHGYDADVLAEVAKAVAVSDTVTQFKKLFIKRFPATGDRRQAIVML